MSSSYVVIENLTFVGPKDARRLEKEGYMVKGNKIYVPAEKCDGDCDYLSMLDKIRNDIRRGK
ncbi:MAG: hypothetical protein GXO64_00545 [Candidatus Micrarchaeota archaeon]|nr:hypothetical protein [Candidatus Micrarchaeota archaeon]